MKLTARFIALAVLVGLVIGFLAVFGTKFLNKPSTVEGTISYSALKPDTTDKGEIRIFAREYGSKSIFEDTGVRVALVNNQAWTWNGAKEGKNYEMQASLYIDGEQIVTSGTETVTAPADGVELPLKVLWQNLPHDVVSNSNLSIGGQVAINGYIPTGSTLRVFATANNANNPPPVMVAQVNNPTSTNTWSWDKAIPLEKYTIQATLANSGGKQIAQNQSQEEIDAAVSNIQLILNSNAQPTGNQVAQAPTPTPSPGQPTPSPVPSGTTTLSGNVNINGPTDNNTSLLLLWKHPGDADYQVINRYPNPSQNGVPWTWNQAQAGQTYEIQAVLQVNNQNTSSSPQPLTVTAPAQNVNFVINTNFVIATPPNAPSLMQCQNINPTKWYATIQLPQVQNAGNYWVQVGSQSGFNDFDDQKILAPANGNGQITVTVPNNTPAYVRYSVASCINCSNNNNFSPWSPSATITCK